MSVNKYKIKKEKYLIMVLVAIIIAAFTLLCMRINYIWAFIMLAINVLFVSFSLAVITKDNIGVLVKELFFSSFWIMSAIVVYDFKEYTYIISQGEIVVEGVVSLDKILYFCASAILIVMACLISTIANEYIKECKKNRNYSELKVAKRNLEKRLEEIRSDKLYYSYINGYSQDKKANHNINKKIKKLEKEEKNLRFELDNIICMLNTMIENWK